MTSEDKARQAVSRYAKGLPPHTITVDRDCIELRGPPHKLEPVARAIAATLGARPQAAPVGWFVWL